MAIRIIGTGSYAPEKILTNADLEKMVETSDEWITTRTGIKQRHIAADGVATSDLAVQAARRAMEMAKITPDQIDFISVATVTGDKAFPSTACFVQKKIEANKAVCYDVVAACSGLLYSLEIAVGMLRSYKKYKYALVIGAEKLSSIVDWQDRSTCVLFGDGAAGVLLERSESQQGILMEELGAKGEDCAVLTARRLAPANAFNEIEPQAECGHVTMDGRAVFKFATKKIVSSIENVLEKSGVSKDEITYFITHQANARIVEVAAKKLKLPMDRFYTNIEHYGNTSAASIPIALNEMNEKGLLHEGDKLILCGFGGGLTWGTLLIQW